MHQIWQQKIIEHLSVLDDVSHMFKYIPHIFPSFPMKNRKSPSWISTGVTGVRTEVRHPRELWRIGKHRIPRFGPAGHPVGPGHLRSEKLVVDVIHDPTF